MIDSIFEKEKEQMNVIIQSRYIIQNITYKLTNDKNSISFFDNVIENVRGYESLERMEKYYFENDLKEMRQVLGLLYKSLQTDTYIKNKTAEEMIKCCNVFPDNIGKRTIILISYIPIIELFFEDLLYKEYFKNYVDLEKKMMGETQQEHQYSRLFEESIFKKKFPKDDEFIDYSMRNDFTNKLKDEYEKTRKEEIKEAIDLLLKFYEESDNSEDNKLSIGSTYWEEKKRIQSKETKAFADAITLMSKAFAEKKE